MDKMSPNIRDAKGTKRPANIFTAPVKWNESIQFELQRKKKKNTIAPIILNIFLVAIFFVA